MKYQITATVNATPKDADALMRLLLEHAESVEFKVLRPEPKQNGRAPQPQGRIIRYSRNAIIRIGDPHVRLDGQRGEIRDAAVEILRKGPKPKMELWALLKAKFPKNASSISPVLTQLLDARALEVVTPPGASR